MEWYLVKCRGDFTYMNAWSFISMLPIGTRKRHILGVFEDRVLRRIFGTKREEVVGD
jgi:hypothetical protein